MNKKWIWMMVGISVVILTSLFQVSVNAETAKGQEMELNTNRPGEDYKDLDLSEADPALCRDACQKEGRCKAWTYVKPGIQADNARCWLKNRIPSAVPDEKCVSGLSQGATATPPIGKKGQKMEMNTNRPGNDYKDLDLSEADPALCRNACQNEGRCKAWTYVKPGIQADNARCWLKNPIPEAVPDENCVSGLKGK